MLWGRTLPEQATSAFTSISPLRIGVLPGRERIASDIIKRGLKEPWFHGTSKAEEVLGPSRGIQERLDSILWEIDPQRGWTHPSSQRAWELNQEANRLKRILGGGSFDPARTGSAHGPYLGEPAGVSLTRSPEVARGFGDVLRVGVDIPPSSVGQFVDPEMQRLLRGAYEQAVAIPSLPPGKMTVAEFLSKTGNMPQMINKETVGSFNQAMSDYLRSQGVEGVAYSPRRFAEYELRVLDPSKAVPLGRLDVPVGYSSFTPTPNVIQRYLLGRPTVPPDVRGKMGQLNELYRNAPEFPSRLSHVLKGTMAD